MPLYSINEFTVESDITLFCDTTSQSVLREDRVLLRRASLADVPCMLRKMRRHLVYDVGDGFLIEPKGNVALHVDLKGKTITLDCPDERLPVAIAWAIHAGLGAATLAHGGLPLHGAGLMVDGRYIGLMAKSGTGKSTLSWHLLQNGFRFGNDDLIPIRWGERAVTAFPSVSLYPKLGRDAVDRHGLDVAALLPADYGSGQEEYYVRLPREKRALEPQPLSAVFVLRPVASGNEGSVVEPNEVVPRLLDVRAAAKALHVNMHAVWLIDKWMDHGNLSRLCREVAECVPVYELNYVRSFAILPRLEAVIRELAARSDVKPG